ncbi:MAG: peptidoglycan-binding domain-containing protein [Bdellovibrionota bacterium]
MKSKSALLSLSVVLACSLVACAKKEPAPQPAPQPVAAEAAPQPAVKKEAKPATVADIQEKLIEHGAKKLKADGKMGPATKAALKKFQAKNGLKKTGVADKETLAKLGLA